MRNHRIGRSVAMLCLLILFAGCNKGVSGRIAAAQVVGGVPTKVTGQAGGAVATVELPADALPDGATVTIGLGLLALPAGLEPVHPTVGVLFSDPLKAGEVATVVFNYDPCLLNLQGAGWRDIVLFRDVAGKVSGVPSRDFDVDPDTNTITVEITESVILQAAVLDGEPVAMAPYGGMARHGIALGSSGSVWTWGWNGFGQLGDGTTSLRNFAAQVTSLDDIVSVEAGEDFSVALRGDGMLYTWGANYGGQLGDGTFVDSPTPVPLFHLPCFVEIAVGAGSRSILALSIDGELYAWGKNEFGQLGDGTAIDAGEPMRVAGIDDPKDFAISGHALAVTQAGKVLAWGGNAAGQLGNGTFLSSGVPIEVPGLVDIVAVAAGPGFSLALRDDGTVWAWGANQEGQLGQSPLVLQSSTPLRIAGLGNIVAIDAMGRTGIALDDAGRVWTWGAGPLGQLGIRIFTFLQFIPAIVGLPAPAIDIDGGNDTAIILLDNGSYYVWGDNALGQLADGGFLPSALPSRVQGPGR